MVEASENNVISLETIVMLPSIVSGQFPYYLSTIGHFTVSDGWYTKRTGRKEYYLLYSCAGEGQMTWHDETVSLPAGSCCLIWCNDYQYYRTASGSEKWEYYYIHFNGTGTTAYAPYLLDKLRCLYPSDLQKMQKIFTYLMEDNLKNDPLSVSKGSLLIQTLLDMLLDALYALSPPPEKIKESDMLLPAYQLISTQYASPITVDQLAQECSLSKYYFLHLFKKVTGETPYQYLTKYRISHARRLLSDSNMPIKNIAVLVGYPNYTNFSTQFKKATGVTPLEYRNASILKSNKLP